MSYPEPRYLGEPGLVNARLRPAGHEPEILVLSDEEKAAFYLRHDTYWR